MLFKENVYTGTDARMQTLYDADTLLYAWALCTKSGNCINDTQGRIGLFIEKPVGYHKI